MSGEGEGGSGSASSSGGSLRVGRRSSFRRRWERRDVRLILHKLFSSLAGVAARDRASLLPKDLRTQYSTRERLPVPICVALIPTPLLLQIHLPSSIVSFAKDLEAFK
ncbi:hypothetical protein KSP40_PGU019179 [Platanthera guangdongensis]|uniref:Uncharacterized protein n=1 Tax=Platanthera guangdongensis TaxID=2320717 RepID=A0ABR2MRY7_9ASPA